MATKLLNHGRRVLAHLPDWADDEAAHVEAEGGPEKSIRSYDLATFTDRLAEDIFTRVAPDGVARPLTEPEVKLSLDGLIAAGLASEQDGQYQMTQAGRDALIAPAEEEDQVPGAVVLELAPARVTADAQASVEGGPQ